MSRHTVGAILALLLLAAPAFAQGPVPQNLSTTGEFNFIAFGIITLVVFGLSALLWMLQLFVAKALVILIPVLCGVIGAVFIPPARQTESGYMLFGLFLIAVGVGGSLACMLYAAIYDLRKKVAKLEGS